MGNTAIKKRRGDHSSGVVLCVLPSAREASPPPKAFIQTPYFPNNHPEGSTIGTIDPRAGGRRAIDQSSNLNVNEVSDRCGPETRLNKTNRRRCEVMNI